MTPVPPQDARDRNAVSPADRDPLFPPGTPEILFVAKVGAAGTELRSGPDPMYAAVKALAPGTILLVVGDRNQFLNVLVPEGFHAFVSRAFVDVAPDGSGRVNAENVNIRSTPSTEGDFPLGQVERGRELWVIGKAGTGDEWLEIVVPEGVPAWVADSAVELGGELTDPAVRAEIASAREKRREDWIEHSTDARQADSQRRNEAELTARVGRIEADIAAEQQRGGAADYTAMRAALAEVQSQSVDPELQRRTAKLLENVTTLEQLATTEREKHRLRDELEAERRRLAEAAERAQQEAVTERFGGPLPPPGQRAALSGFLRLRADDAQHPVALERGSRVAAWLQCSTGRYRLKDFAGLQVEVRGPVLGNWATGSSASDPPTLEVERLLIVRR